VLSTQNLMRFSWQRGHPVSAISNHDVTLSLWTQQRFRIKRFVRNDPSSDYREIPGRNGYENLGNSQLKIAVVIQIYKS
jgi:hypothetical protein